MNKKGFTLIELLGVLVILGTILLVAIPSISSSLEKNKQKDKNRMEESILKAAEIYISNHKKDIDYDSFLQRNCSVSLNVLIDANLLSDEEIEYLNKNYSTYYIVYQDNKVSISDTQIGGIC